MISRRRWWVLGVAAFLTMVGWAVVSMAAGQKKAPPAKPIDINTATAAQLEQLPGIGPATARAIVRFREKSGPFRRVEELRAVPRISKLRFQKLRPYVMVGKPTRRPKS
jgi:competence ComEA-like helix-hairpin-helix protein